MCKRWQSKIFHLPPNCISTFQFRLYCMKSGWFGSWFFFYHRTRAASKLHLIVVEVAIGSADGAMMQKSRTITLQFGAESSQRSAEREFFSSGLRLLQHTYWNWKLFVCFSRATSAKWLRRAEWFAWTWGLHSKSVYELAELNTKRACVHGSSRKRQRALGKKLARLLMVWEQKLMAPRE